MHSTVLLIFLIFGSVDTCLVVNQVTCDCPYIPLASSYPPLDDLPRDWNYTGNAAMAPRISSSKCYLAMSCPDGYNLIIHDTNTSTMFGSFAVEAYCDAKTQKWRADKPDYSQITFDRMYAICVDFTKPRPWSVAPENDCVCPYTLLDYAGSRLAFHDYYVSHLSKYQLSKPKMSMDSSGTCPRTFDCGSLLTVVIADNKVYENPTGEFICDSKRRWSFPESSQGAGYLFATCIDLNKPRSAPTPKCNCKYEIIPNESPNAKPWLIASDQISEDRCIWNIYCFYTTDLKVFNAPNSDSAVGYIWQGKCNPKTNEWDLIWEPYFGKVYRNVPVFGFNCVFYR